VVKTPVADMGNITAVPYWNPLSPVANTVTLINYKTFSPMQLPPDDDFIFSWCIVF
jgi:hypothetical protein